jgi:hypothetical protein
MFNNAKDAQKYFPKWVFSRWMIDNLQNEDINEAYSPYLRNARIDGIGTKIRSWYSEVADCPWFPVSHLWFWNRVETNWDPLNLLIYAQNNSDTAIAGQVGLYNIDTDTCISPLGKVSAYWLWPITTTFTSTPSENISFTAELGSFAPVAIDDGSGNIVQQFDPSAAKNFYDFQKFYTQYANTTIADWNLITNGIIHVDYGDGITRDVILNFSGDANMAAVYARFKTNFDGLLRWQSITTGYLKRNTVDIWPFNFSTATDVETISSTINVQYGSNLTYIRYGVNQSGEEVPYIVFSDTTLTSIDKSTTGQWELLWLLLWGDQLPTTSQFIPSRLQDVRMDVKDRIYGSNNADAYYLYNAHGAQKWFFVVDGFNYKTRLSLKPNGVKPSIGCIFDSFHFIAWDQNFSSSLFQSVRGYYEDFESIWSDRYTFDGPIRAVKTNNTELYVFTSRGVGLLQAGWFTSQWGIYRYNIQQLEAQEGALSQAWVVDVGHRIYFWTPSNKIKVVGRQAGWQYDISDLSHREGLGIDYTMKYVVHANQTNMFATYIPEENIIKWVCRSVDSSGPNDMAIIYDVEHDSWLVDTYSRTTFTHGAHDGNNTFFAGVVAGSSVGTASKIYKDVVWTNDDTAPISFIYYTKRWNFWTPTREKQFWGWRLFMDMIFGSSMTYGIYVDNVLADSKTLSYTDGATGTGNRILDPNRYELCWPITKWRLRKKGKNIYILFGSTSWTSQVTIKDMELAVLGMPDETSNKNNS